jgi:hypothetical protein
MAKLARTLTLALLAALALAATAPADPLQDATAGCDPIDPAACMLPFPNDAFTKPDASTPTGRRIDFSVLGMPRNRAGKPIDPTDWNRGDGFSPGSMIVTKVPGMDNARAFANTNPVPITDIGAYGRSDAPVVVIDAATGRRWPIWTELDYSIGTGADTDQDRMLLIRPARNFLEGHRYVVALRHMKDGSGREIPAGDAFRAYRDGTATGPRAQHFASLFHTLARAAIARRSLFLAWDFTVASRQSTTSRILTIRDDAFRQLGDTNLADMKIQGSAPAFQVKRVIDDTCDAGVELPDPIVYDTSCAHESDSRMAFDIKGTMDVPCYLSTPACAPAHAHFVLNPLTGLPVQIPGNVAKVDFECRVPKVALSQPSRPSLYGHGLFGGYGEIHQGQLTNMMAEHDFSFCATDWAGMAAPDVPNVATILADLSGFDTLADRLQQGMLNFLYLGRLMIHPDGLCTQPPFRTASGACVFDTRRLFYDGNSQGGIIGGALAAVAPDYDRAVLGVMGMNFSTLLTRSTDFGAGNPPAIVSDPANPDNLSNPTNGVEYAWPLYTAYPQLNERQLIFDLMQMLWDRSEPDGYAQHMTDHPLPNTPKHEVLLMAGYGDHQVANVAAEVEARTIGARILKEDVLPPGRSWEKDPWWGLDPVARFPARGVSVFTIWDGGSRPAPLTNIAPTSDEDDDPHEWVRNTPAARAMKASFLAIDSSVVDTCGTGPCLTYNYPYKGGEFSHQTP